VGGLGVGLGKGVLAQEGSQTP